MTDHESTTTVLPQEGTNEAATPATKDLDSLPEWAKSEIQALRRESGEHSTRLSAYEKAEQVREQASLSELEKANATATKATERAAALEARLVERDAISALAKANLIDTDLGLLAIRNKIVVADGEATNLDELVAELVKTKPHLVKADKPTVPDTKSTAPATKQETTSRHRVWGKI